MAKLRIADLLAYTVVVVTLGLAFLIFVGLLFPGLSVLPPYIPLELRVMFGIVALLMGVYRLAMMRFHAAQSSRDDD
ncbi:MAG: hypothetical protein ONB48_17425 [candidate division KSB1 bacterium]|nr:hypothetical protein [candidate division KSB1 bacterium]MDZ7275261.1 hypothetical protein [candidate division KSB1 bacterium]MDZ7287429.1 hypothetical protein [candidate division KSB1 bacterium]MDZ7299543.1 hypothetical protein [candidate division KSB1 bacterium]MDZ7309096.1 hypothetical protein [candidate division KSB1 bacterium]